MLPVLGLNTSPQRVHMQAEKEMFLASVLTYKKQAQRMEGPVPAICLQALLTTAVPTKPLHA
jgi:hypothetical protein